MTNLVLNIDKLICSYNSEIISTINQFVLKLLTIDILIIFYRFKTPTVVITDS